MLDIKLLFKTPTLQFNRPTWKSSEADALLPSMWLNYEPDPATTLSPADCCAIALITSSENK